MDLGDTISLVFSETMDTGSIVLSGNLGNAGVTEWQTLVETDDRVIIEPTGTACDGSPCFTLAGGNLIVDATDLSGEPLETYTMSFDLDNDGDGTPENAESPAECNINPDC